MKIAVDISPLTTGHKGRGTGRYTGLILAALKQAGTPHEFIEYTDTIISDADITFYPYFDPFFMTLPIVKSGPSVVTVHDLIPFAYPEKFKPGIRGEIKWRLQHRALSRVDAVITDSEASKADIIKYAGIRQEKISVIYLAPTMNFGDGTVTEITEVRARFGFSGRYILYVGDVNFNKNIPNLLRSFALISKDLPDVRLVLVGRAFTDPQTPQTRELLALSDVLGVGKRLVRTGYIDESDLKALYLSADCFTLPSLAEGFGLPLLDAMSAGCITVTSGASSLKEIAGPSITVDPEKPENITMGLMKALTMPPGEKQRFRKTAARWAGRFTWEKTAAETIKVLESVIGK